MARIHLCTLETDRSCAVCERPGAMAWGALCADCEDAMAEVTDGFQDKDWDEFTQLGAKEAAQRIIARRQDACEWSELLRDECPHCTGDLTGLA